jgi:hypothetical protein
MPLDAFLELVNPPKIEKFKALVKLFEVWKPDFRSYSQLPLIFSITAINRTRQAYATNRRLNVVQRIPNMKIRLCAKQGPTINA